MKNFNKIFWGLFFLVAGAFVIFNQMGYYTNFNLVTLILTIFMVAIFIKSIYPVKFFGLLFSLAALVIIYDKQLNLEVITPWPVLITALLGTIGLSIIFPRHNYSKCNNKHFDKVIDDIDEDVINYEIRFGSSVKYINSDNFKEANFSCAFGALSIYFNNAKMENDVAIVNLDASFSGVELYIPKEWKVINELDSNLAGIEEKNNSSKDSSKTLKLRGRVNLSGLEIIYI